MKYSEKIKLCKEVNSDPIYQLYSCGVRCCCYRDCHGAEHLQVMHLGYHSSLNSSICNKWEEDYALEWIMQSTQALKYKLGLEARI